MLFQLGDGHDLPVRELRDPLEGAAAGATALWRRAAYARFLDPYFDDLNSRRQERFPADQQALRPLPSSPLAYYREQVVRVTQGSLIRVRKNWYSVNSRRIGCPVRVRIYPERLEVWVGAKCVERRVRIHGQNQCQIDYRHGIDSRVAKPSAFANYRHRRELFPGHSYRLAYDRLLEVHPEAKGIRIYLEVLQLAARAGTVRVRAVLDPLYPESRPVTVDTVREYLKQPVASTGMEVAKPAVSLKHYDQLLSPSE